MADILIRGIELPSKGCLRCPFNLYYANAVYCNCMIIKLLGKPSEAKYPNEVNCSLHELPEHGDLIERDALKHKFCAHCDGYEYDTGACVDGDQDCMDAKIIMNAPVIVPSNKEETE